MKFKVGTRVRVKDFYDESVIGKVGVAIEGKYNDNISIAVKLENYKDDDIAYTCYEDIKKGIYNANNCRYVFVSWLEKFSLIKFDRKKMGK